MHVRIAWWCNRPWGHIQPVCRRPCRLRCLVAALRLTLSFLLRARWRFTFAWDVDVVSEEASIAALRNVARLHASLGWAVLHFWTGVWATERRMRHHEHLACYLCGDLGTDLAASCCLRGRLVDACTVAATRMPRQAQLVRMSGAWWTGGRRWAPAPTPPLPSTSWSAHIMRLAPMARACFFTAAAAQYRELRRRYSCLP